MTSLGAPESLWLVWSTNPQAGYDEVLMDPQGGGSFVGEIPAPGGATDIWYYLDARSLSYSWPLPVRGTYRFHAGPDTVRPAMRELSQLSPSIRIEAPQEITVLASDNLGLDVGSGLVHYAAGDLEGEFPLTLDAWIGEEAQLVSTLPSVGSYGDTVSYWCSIADTAGSPNTGYSDTLWYLYGLDDFETGLDGWDTGTGWGLSSSGNPHSGDSLVTDSPVGQYANNEDNPLTFTGGLDLHAEDSAALSFWVLHALETDHDFCHVEASRDGATWTTLLSLTGRQMTWTNYQVSLNGFVGTGCDSVLVRFRLVSDDQGTDLGVYLDDVLIATGVTPAYDPATPPARPTILSVGPNPARGTLGLRVAGVGRGQIRLRIYDVSGRVVRTLTASEGQTLVRWDGLDDGGTILPSGMYHVRIEGRPVHRKVILIR
jgi:hypothetical protein